MDSLKNKNSNSVLSYNSGVTFNYSFIQRKININYFCKIILIIEILDEYHKNEFLITIIYSGYNGIYYIISYLYKKYILLCFFI